MKGPSFYNPRRHPRRALDRRNLVLDAMVDNGVLSRKRADDDEAQPLGVVAEGRTAQREYPAYLDLVRRHLQRDYKEDDLTTEGLRIFTGFSPLVQHAAEQSVTRMLDRLGNNKLEAAMVVVNPSTGEVEAVVGGRDPRFAGFNRALDIRRPIGSLVKPAIYLSALSQPERYGLGTPLDDDPVRLRDPDTGKEWAPSNYDDSFRGDVLLVDALAHSYNVPTVRLGLDVGLRTVTNTFDRLGGRCRITSIRLPAGRRAGSAHRDRPDVPDTGVGWFSDAAACRPCGHHPAGRAASALLAGRASGV